MNRLPKERRRGNENGKKEDSTEKWKRNRFRV